jgi:alcohol dehydrogenase class IV
MQSFECFGVGRIIFGQGGFARAGQLAASLGTKALLIYNGDSLIDRLVEMLSKDGVTPIIRRQRGEPTVEDIDAAIVEARQAECDCAIGLGGGSAIDAAKAVAGLLSNGGACTDYMEVVGRGEKITRPAAHWMAIPTTAGTGAEATRNAVIGFPAKKFKASIRSELLLPRIALIDPALGVTVPPAVTASCGMDALCQLIESHTSTGASPITDALSLQGIGMAARCLPRVFQDGKDLEAREGMALAALLSGITLTSAGLGAVHGFAAPLGANFPVPHGTVCAALLPHVIAANVEAALRKRSGEAGARGLNRYAAVGRQLPGLESASGKMAVAGLIEFTADLLADLRIPPLKEFGLRAKDIPEMVALARKASSMRFNPVTLSDEELAGILNTAIEGEVSS